MVVAATSHSSRVFKKSLAILGHGLQAQIRGQMIALESKISVSLTPKWGMNVRLDERKNVPPRGGTFLKIVVLVIS